MNYDKKDDAFEFLNLSGSSSNLNSPVTGQTPGLPQQGVYQQLSRPVPGLKTDYNLKKASSQTELGVFQPHVSQEDVTLFLDELNSLNSPSNQLQFNQFDSRDSYINTPVIISTPPQEDNGITPGNVNAMDMDMNMNVNNNQVFNDFLQPDFQGASFIQQRSPQASDLASSVSNSPFLQAYSPAYDDDIISNNGELMDYGLVNNEVDLLSAQMDMRLTEENLHQVTQSPVTINILTAPEDKTPSLFSSNKSSNNNTPNHSRTGSNSSSHLKSGHLNDSNLLNPDDLHDQMRTGRQRRQSRSRSPSRDRSLSTNREKMLELASPNATNKRSQKHPSIYACHLCEKRFTRPYNLKSHLRTHTDERPFVCTVCGKAFARQHDRKRHEELHSGEKRFECRGFLRDSVSKWGCGKKFARTDALGRHFKTEAGKECIRPLVEEHEREMREQAAANGTQFTAFDMNTLPEQLYTQFPGLMHPSQNNSGVSDLSDVE